MNGSSETNPLSENWVEHDVILCFIVACKGNTSAPEGKGVQLSSETRVFQEEGMQATPSSREQVSAILLQQDCCRSLHTTVVCKVL